MIPEQLCRQLCYLFQEMNEETDGDVNVKEFFEGMSRRLQIIKHLERVERDNFRAYERELNDPDPDKRKKTRS